MPETRIFLYSGNVDEAFKAAAKKDLIDAKWMPIRELSERTQIMACTGPDRRHAFHARNMFTPLWLRDLNVAELPAKSSDLAIIVNYGTMQRWYRNRQFI